MLASSLALLLVAATADSSGDAAKDVQELVVTAPLHSAAERSLQGVDIIGEAELQKLPPVGLGDALEQLPGISSTSFGAGASRPVIRGLGEDRIRILSNGIGVIDESAASPDHAVAAEGSEATRIEVLRGPQALAYGSNAIGGVVNVIDGLLKQELPDRPIGGGAVFNYSTADDGFQGAAHVDLKAGPIAIRAQGGIRETDDYRIPNFAESPLLRQITGSAGEAGRGRLLNSDLDSANFATGISFVQDERSIGATYRRLVSNYAIPGEGENGPRIDLKQDRVELRGDTSLKLGVFDHAKVSATYGDYQHVELEGGVTPSTTFFAEGFEARAELGHRPIFGSRGVIGLQATRVNNGAIGEESFIAPNLQRDLGIFVVEEWTHGPYAVQGGLRVENRRIAPENASPLRFTPVSFSFGGSIKLSPNLFTGLHYARTERAPSSGELFSFGPHLATANFIVGNREARKEVGNAFELAVHYETGEGQGAWRIDLHGFHNRFANFIDLAPTGQTIEDLAALGLVSEEAASEFPDLPVFIYGQRAAIYTGGEIEISRNLWSRGDLKVDWSGVIEIVRARFPLAIVSDDASAPSLLPRSDVPRIPPLNATLALSADWRRLFVKIEGVIASAQNNVAEFELPTRGYTLLNTQLAWKPFADGRISLLFDARNLVDSDVRYATSFLKDVAPLPGRNFRFSVKLAL